MLMFVDIARAGSLSGAARTLDLTPSAVSQQLALLEAEAGHPLVQRTGKGVLLTEAGKIVLRHAERIQRSQSAARRAMDDLDSLRAGTLRLGTFPTLTQSLLPGILKDYRDRARHVEIALTSGTRVDLLARLESGDLEIAFLWDYAWSPFESSAEITVAHLADDPCVLLVPQQHRLAGAVSAVMADAQGEKWIGRSTPEGQDLLRRAVGGNGSALQLVFEGQTYVEMQAMVAAGLGIALAPQSAAAVVHPGVSVIPLVGAPVRRFWFAHRALDRLTPAAAAMNALLRSRAEVVSRAADWP